MATSLGVILVSPKAMPLIIMNTTTPTIIDFDTTGVVPSDRAEQKKTQTLNILLLLLMTSGGIFGTLQYAESRMNENSSRLDKVPTTILLPENISSAEVTDDFPDPARARLKMSEDVIQALHWLGKKSLEEYRLTHPPEDNAYYYFSRLLEADSGDKVAAAGLLNIADRYASLAERSILDNDYSRAQAYIMIGRKFNPNHEALIKLNKLNLDVKEKSFMEKLKILFTGD